MTMSNYYLLVRDQLKNYTVQGDTDSEYPSSTVYQRHLFIEIFNEEMMSHLKWRNGTLAPGTKTQLQVSFTRISLDRFLESLCRPTCSTVCVYSPFNNFLSHPTARRALFGEKLYDPWAMLEALPRVRPESAGIVRSVQQMSDLKSGLARARVWLRMALMEKVSFHAMSHAVCKVRCLWK